MLTAESTAALKTLIRQRGNIQGAVTSFSKKLDAYEAADSVDRDPFKLQSALDGLRLKYQKFSDIQDQIEELDETEISKRIPFDESYEDVIGTALRLLSNNATQHVSTHTPSPATPATVPVKLPQMNLPKFDGSIENWNAFFDLFSSLIDKNETLSPVQKLTYLRSSVTGKAATAIDSLPTTDRNYGSAIEILRKKFDCVPRILRRHWTLLREYPRLQRDTSTALGDLVDTVNLHVRALHNLGQPTESWDLPLIDLILSKISSDTVWQWELTLTNSDLPTYTSLLEFLEKRANCTDPSSATSAPRNRPQQEISRHKKNANGSTRQTFATVSTPPCSICSETNHYIMKCPKFLAMSLAERQNAVRASSLCYNCLRSNHQLSQCTSQSRPLTCRALLDTGSTTNFITENVAALLGIQGRKCVIPVGSLNATTTIVKQLVTVTIRSKHNGYERTVECMVVPQISQLVPDQRIYREVMKLPRNLKLADPNFHRPGPVDVLLSAGIALSTLCVGKIELSSKGEPDLFLQKTLFGWVIGGSAPAAPSPRQRSCHATTNNLEASLTKFWSLEEATAPVWHRNADEAHCEQHFRENVTRDSNGRYVVALPFNDKQSELGESRSRAIHRLISIERKLRRDPELGLRYNAVLQEYLDLGHMTETKPTDQGYYLPHHAVIKDVSLTTKVRVVFDGSAQTSTGISLNDTLRVGPTIQDDIFSLLLRFRTHPWVLTGDIEKMYRQILVRPEDRKYQRIVWRNGEGIKTYQLNTVTFGLSAAPYLAIRCLHQLAEDEGHRYPAAAKILKQDLYVDDLLTGAQTREEAIKLRDEIDQLLKLGGFNLRQWASNEPELLAGLPERDMNLQLQLGGSSTLKTLGVFWNSTTDDITYTVKLAEDTSRVTKRIILSETAKVFDPLGLLGPVVILAKAIMQKLWTLKLHWDEALPTEIHTEWVKFYAQLPLLNNLSFQRATVLENTKEIQLHGFCDASQMAYGACIYLRSITMDGKVSTSILCAKSRVAPLKPITIPRLELCGAQLLANLMTTVQTAIKIKVPTIIYWTDSTIVLHWLNTIPQRLQTFVANRVADIQSKSNIKDWRHVRTHENPADLISRGQRPDEFVKPSFWQTGPPWLQTEESTWPVLPLTFPDTPLEHKKKICLAIIRPNNELLSRYSSMEKLQRIVAYCLRFKLDNTHRGELTLAELTAAHDKIIRLTQEANFSDLITVLKTPEKQKDVRIHKFENLHPFLDKEGIIRVGGRLQRAMIPFAQRHPIILPKGHHVTKLIIEREHHLQLHAGAQATLYAVRQRYWPIDGRNAVRLITRACIKCFRQKPPPVDYIMGNLPEARVTESRPFTNVGIDYCGPFYIKEKRYRNRGRIKVYVAVFICLAVKAVHLEVVSDLTTEAFIAALDRFIGRRGICTNIYSDNGTNFVGANNEMREIYKLLQSEDHRQRVSQFAINHAIAWHFIPPQSPHFGGLWEAAVKSFKHHLRRIVGTEMLTFEGLTTLVIEIEAVLNSRPLTALSSDSNDPLALTPGHFLIGAALNCRPQINFTDTPVNRLSMWQHIQGLKQHFWSRWHREYITELNKRTKWIHGAHSIQRGTVVLLKEDNLPALQWAMGRVTEIHPGADGIVRTVTIKTAKGTFDRNVKKLAPLPLQEEEARPATAVNADQSPNTSPL